MFSPGESPIELSPEHSGPSTPGTEPSILFDSDVSSATDKQCILVTGGLGFIGSHTSLELLKAGYNIVIVDDLSNSFSDVFSRVLTTARNWFDKTGGTCPKAVFHHAKYQDIPVMRALLESYRSVDLVTGKIRNNIVGIIHFASFKATEESIKEPLRYYRNNINGLVDFLDLIDEYDLRNFVFSSSAAVYGSLADHSDILREEQVAHQVEYFHNDNGDEVRVFPGCTGITSPYGRTKYFGEAILSDLGKSNPNWKITCLRYFNPIGCDPAGLLGEDPKGVPSNLIPVVAKVLTGQWNELQIFGTDWETRDGSAIRDFIHVSDLARGHIAALSAAQSNVFEDGFRAINLGTGAGHTVLEVVAAMEAVSGKNVRVKIAERRAGDVQSSVAATDRAAKELGWRPTETLLDACMDLWNFLMLKEDWRWKRSQGMHNPPPQLKAAAGQATFFGPQIWMTRPLYDSVNA